MIIAEEIFKRLFIWGVAAVAVAPRQHIDRTRCSIGGSLSSNFKKLLLVLVAINFVRLLMKDSYIKAKVQVARDILGVAQQLGNSFLCFLSPYILQTWLANMINLGGRPGANLMPYLYASTLLSILASILARTTHPNFWALRKLGNAISSVPVVGTLRSFNSVSSRGGFHEGRGTILSQTLMTVEYWYICGQLLAVIGFAMNRGPTIGHDETTQLDELFSAFRKASFVLDWTRILAHAIFMNQLDELHLSSSPPSSNGNGNSRSPSPACSETEVQMEEFDKGDSSGDLVPLVKIS